MKRFSRTVLTVAALGLAFSAASRAEAQVKFGIAGGPSFATGDFGDGLDMGYHVQASAAFSFPLMPIGIRAEGAWNRWNVSDTEDGNVQSLSGAINAVISLPTPGITPYLIGGVGYYNLSTSPGDFSSSDFGVNAGVGVDMSLPGLGAFIEARLHNVFGEVDSIRFVPISIGLRM